MSDGITTSLISAAALVLVAYVTFVLNKKMQIAAAWRDQKLEYYRDFFDTIALNVEGDDTPETHRQFARETNNMHLVASKSVLKALHAYREHISVSNTSRDYALDDVLLANLLKAMRADLGMPDGDDLHSSHVKLWSSGQTRLR